MRAVVANRTAGMPTAGPEPSRNEPEYELLAVAFAVVVATSAICGCTALEDYSIRAAERSCATLSVCTVYGPSGEHLSPCISSRARQSIRGSALALHDAWSVRRRSRRPRGVFARRPMNAATAREGATAGSFCR